MNRGDFKIIASLRLKESRTLLRTKNYSGAYYLCGYVVECGLKACIAKQTNRFEFPDKNKVMESYTHNLPKLVKWAGLETALKAAESSNPVFAAYWLTVKDWSEESRYERHSQLEAQNLYNAVSDQAHGVLQWIKRYW